MYECYDLLMSKSIHSPASNHQASRRRRAAFTLVEMALVIGFAGLIAAVVLKTTAPDPNACLLTTQQQLKTIQAAMNRYTMDKNRYPRPAQRTVGVDSPVYGREATAAQVNVVGTGHEAVMLGALPFQELGLPAESGSDCWGNKLTYVVTQGLTDVTNFNATNPVYNGAITIKSSTSVEVSNRIAYAIISHGADGVGAVKSNYSGADKKWCQATVAGDGGSAAPLQNSNCSTSSTLMDAAFNDGKKNSANAFDDVIIYGGGGPCCPYWGNCGV